MLIETETEFTTRLAADQDFDWDTVTQTQEPIAIPVGATSLASTGNYLSEITLPLDNLAAPPIVGDRTPILVHLVIRGTTLDGDKVESSVLQFPIDICNSCLTDITCPSGTVLVPVEQIPCHLGQDFHSLNAPLRLQGVVMFEELLTGMVQKPGLWGRRSSVTMASRWFAYAHGPACRFELGDELWEAASIDLLRSLEGMRQISHKLNPVRPSRSASKPRISPC